MSKIPAQDINFTVGALSIEDELSSAALNITNEAPVTTGFSDAGPRRVEGNYDYSFDIEGFFDGAAAQGDATIFGTIGGGAAGVVEMEPTGQVVGASDPHYDGVAILTSYSVRGAAGGPVTYAASFAGSAAIDRAVA